MRRTRIVMLTAAVATVALAVPCLLGGCASTRPAARDDPLISRIRRDLPQDWTCTVQQNAGRKGHPHGLEEPRFRADLTNASRTFERRLGKMRKELNPVIPLYFYDIRSKAHVMEVIEKERNYSWNIPIYFGETSQYVVVTSPAYVNHGCFTPDAKQAIAPAWSVLRKHIESKEETTVEQLAEADK